LKTANDGAHTHDYKDIYFSEFKSLTNDWTNVPNNRGADGGDQDNVGHQITRTTFSGGYHNHYLNGNTLLGSATLTGTGGNQLFDVRPFFTVVQFIIYIKN
jgi:hypothetical protein